MDHLLREQKVRQELVRQQIRRFLREEDPLDEDGYPTEGTLWAIAHWPWDDSRGWFSFLQKVWYMADWGWHETEESRNAASDGRGERVRRYRLSTAGWSGNESLVQAMKENEMLWHFTWVQSRRGGHYIFEDPGVGPLS
jgi:hypothetical protein